MSGGSGSLFDPNSPFAASIFGATPTVQGSSTPTAQPGTTPAWQTAANPQQMQPNPNPYAPPTPTNMPPPVTDMGPGVNAASNWLTPDIYTAHPDAINSSGVNSASNWSPQQLQQQLIPRDASNPILPAPQAQQGGIGGLAQQQQQQPSYLTVQPYQQPAPQAQSQAPAFGGAYTQKYYNRS